MRKIIFILLLIVSLPSMAQLSLWNSFYQLSADRTDTLHFKSESDSGFVITSDTAVYFITGGDTGRFVFDTIYFQNGNKFYGESYTDSLTKYWDSTEVPVKVASQINDSLDRIDNSLSIHNDTSKAHRTDINALYDTVSDHLDTLQDHRTDINTKLETSAVASQIHDTAYILRSEYTNNDEELSHTFTSMGETHADTLSANIDYAYCHGVANSGVEGTYYIYLNNLETDGHNVIVINSIAYSTGATSTTHIHYKDSGGNTIVNHTGGSDTDSDNLYYFFWNSVISEWKVSGNY